jgi:hypothetical protein
MFDKFQFSDGQDLATLDATGVISDGYWDIEKDDAGNELAVDGMIEGWLNIRLLSIANDAATAGMYISLIESDATAGTTPSYLGVLQLLPAEIKSGNQFSIGVSKQLTKRYLSVWYKRITADFTNANTIEAWFSTGALTSPTFRSQKRPS